MTHRPIHAALLCAALMILLSPSLRAATQSDAETASAPVVAEEFGEHFATELDSHFGSDSGRKIVSLLEQVLFPLRAIAGASPHQVNGPGSTLRTVAGDLVSVVRKATRRAVFASQSGGGIVVSSRGRSLLLINGSGTTLATIEQTKAGRRESAFTITSWLDPERDFARLAVTRPIETRVSLRRGDMIRVNVTRQHASRQKGPTDTLTIRENLHQSVMRNHVW